MVYPTEQQFRDGKALAAKQGISFSELVRRAVDRMLASDPSWDDDDTGRAAGILRRHRARAEGAGSV
jgi:hypothetical protein